MILLRLRPCLVWLLCAGLPACGDGAIDSGTGPSGGSGGSGGSAGDAAGSGGGGTAGVAAGTGGDGGGSQTLTPLVGKLSSGDGFSCVLDVSGTPVCWGAGFSNSPERDGFVQIALGETESCALDESGLAHCWGGLSLNGEVTLPSPNGPFVQVIVGRHNLQIACGVRTTGDVECWRNPVERPVDEEFLPPPGVKFSKLSASGLAICGLRKDRGIECWGEGVDFAPEEWVAPAGQYSDVVAGDSHACGLDAAGAVTCWGSTTSHGLEGAFQDDWRAVALSGYAGQDFDDPFCALLDDGRAVCYARGSGDDVSPPDVDLRFRALSVGRRHFCGITTQGKLYCWGFFASDDVLQPPDNVVIFE